MNIPLVTSLIGLMGTAFLAGFTYWSTKRRERDAEWRKEKLVYYKAFIESLSGIVRGDETPEGHKIYAKTTNNLLLFAPQSVIKAVNAFRDEIAISNPTPSRERFHALLTDLVLAIRKDVGVRPFDDPATFQAVLWTSGVVNKPDDSSVGPQPEHSC
jgi:hypothetical protein